MPTLSELEAFYAAHGGLINLIGVLIALLGIAISIYFGVRSRQSKEDRYAKEKLQKDQELTDEQLKAVGEELARVRGELAALQAATLNRDRARSEAAEATLGRIGARLDPKRVKVARRALAKGQTKEAEKLFREVLENDAEYAHEAAYQLGALAENRFDFAAAKDWYFKAVELEPDNPVYLAAAGRLALDFDEIGKAGDLLGKALNRLSDQSELRARVLNGLGNVRYAQARYGEAEDYHRQALDIQEKAVGKEHADTATFLNNVGIDCFAQRRYREAESCHRQALDIRETALGPEHPDTAASLDCLGTDCSAQGRYGEAEGYHRQAFVFREKVLGKEHPDTARSLSNLGIDCNCQGRYGEAEGYQRQAFVLREKVLGKDHPDTACSLNNLGSDCNAQGRHGEAEGYHRRALAIREKVLGPEHSDTAESLNSLVYRFNKT